MGSRLTSSVMLEYGEQVGALKGAARGAAGELSARAEVEPAPAQESETVSVVIPCFNEEKFIGEVLRNLARQGARAQSEIIVVDGMSTDGTRAEVERFARENPEARVRVVENPERHIPAALNRGIGAARGPVIARMDAHAVPSENYLRACLEQLGREGVAIVGAPCRIRAAADTSVARANAAAVSHPFGIGDAQYRTAGAGGESRFVDTVPFGVFRKELWQRLGGYNEELLTNEDYDFNYRARLAGGGVLLDTSCHSTYFARPTFASLARQYFRYGVWKARMLRLHPRSVRPRQLVAPAFVLALVVLSAASPWLAAARWLLALTLAPYALLSLACAAAVALREREWTLLLLLPVSFLLIHLSWGAGFWLGLLSAPRKGVAG
jgi:succinoglycan biosynthesis protein ExoA